MEKRSFKGFSCTAVWWSLAAYILLLSTQAAEGHDGAWSLLVENAGIASMHTQVTRYGTVLMLDRTEVGPSNISLPKGECRVNPVEGADDCTAHSVELTPNWVNSTIRPLFIYTDTWCSSGQVTSDGTLVQTGGNGDGSQIVRTFAPCPPGGLCDWVETGIPLKAPRWYSTNHILEDGDTQVVIGGQNVFSMEFVPANGRGLTTLQLLLTTDDSHKDSQTDNLYPFVNLLPDGTLWIFANQDSIIYDYKNQRVVKNLPRLEGGPRNYPSAGSSVMLPLESSNGFKEIQLLVCGGAQAGANSDNSNGIHMGAQQTCGRMTLTDPKPAWTMEMMPCRRTMGDMVLLPTKEVLIINGAQNGSSGWEKASVPALHPVIYSPDQKIGSRFRIQEKSYIPRMYHSTANLLPDGRVLIAGSNPHQYYTFSGEFPTELRVEAFSPKYMALKNIYKKPFIISGPDSVPYGSSFNVTFLALQVGKVEVTMTSASFHTHSYGQGQRLLVLAASEVMSTKGFNTYQVTVTAPPHGGVAPKGYYMTFVVNDGIPSAAKWIQVL
ncbi:unnamed protein product [Calypogeia fissa]